MDLSHNDYNWTFTYAPGTYRLQAEDLLIPTVDTSGLGVTTLDIGVTFWLSIVQRI